MIINISELLSTSLKTEKHQVPVTLDSFMLNGETFPLTTDRTFDLTLSNVGTRKVLLQGNWTCSLTIPCDRCLKPVSVFFDIVVDEELDLSEERDEDEADDSYLTDDGLDTDALVNHEILIRFPMKTLCREACKGICLKCGKDLNEGECGCDRSPVDPRMAAIQDIFKNFKEV